jgi:hypothetical protein
MINQVLVSLHLYVMNFAAPLVIFEKVGGPNFGKAEFIDLS